LIYSCDPKEEKLWDQLSLTKAMLLAEFEHDNKNAVFLLDRVIKRSVDQALLDRAESYRAVLISNVI